jgi:DNA-binding LytR/AlgR family response regulator
LPLRQLLSKLPEDRFVQIHRSYLVNLDRVKGVEGNQLRIGSKLLPVSRNNREHVLQRLLGDRLL